MNRDCSIVRDLLPLYDEGMLTDDSAEFVRAHLDCCTNCAAEARSVAPLPAAEAEPLPLDTLRQRLRLKRLLAAMLGILLAALALVCIYAAMDAPDYVPYSAELIDIDAVGSDLVVSFSPDVRDFEIRQSSEPDSGQPIYTIEAWSSRWDSRFSPNGNWQTVIEGGTGSMVFYAQNNGGEDICVYGAEKLNGGMVTLPALRLGYYLIIMMLAFVLLVSARLIFRRSKASAALEIAALYPLSYLLSHIVLGIGSVSYSFMRDLTLLLSVSVLIFLLLILVRELWKCIK